MGVKKMQDVFIIGAKGIGNYGGYETFLRKLIETDKNDKEIKYHIACKFNGQGAMDESKLPGAQIIILFITMLTVLKLIFWRN